ncbi:MAG: helix-turn-helix transcriptional regulator [Cyclobacteriaceae bacterium]
MRLKLGLSQEKFAQNLGIKRGRLTPYEDKSSGDPDFYRIIVAKYNIDLHKFLMDEMNDDNYSSFFTTRPEATIDIAEEESGTYFNKSKIIDLIQQIKNESDPETRAALSDTAISLVAKLMEENNELRKEVLDIVLEKKK